MKTIIIFITIYIFINTVFAGSQFCIKKGGSCCLGGVGPTYTCGKKCGFKNYSGTFKRWDTDVGFNQCFHDCCEPDKEYCHESGDC